jgi:glycosyltransferase involved in cell wall biosynthesis
MQESFLFSLKTCGGLVYLKVAVIMPLAEARGGAEQAFVVLLQKGRDENTDFVAIFLKKGPLVGEIKSLGIPAYAVEAGKMRELHRFAGATRQIAAILRKEKVDAVISWMGPGHLYGGLAAAQARIPTVWFQHGVPLDKNIIDRIAARIPTRGILTCSQAGADAQVVLTPQHSPRVVHPGAELDRFDPASLPSPAEARRRCGLPETGPVIGIVGRLQRWKGMHVFAEAMVEVLKTHPDASGVIVGGDHEFEPEYPAFLQQRIADLGMTDRIKLAGIQKNVPEWMQAMDVVVHASDSEPFGIVIVEGMALGKPVVAGDKGGPREIIEPGVTGLLTPYGDSAALAAAINRYLDDPAFAARIGAAARKRAQLFSVDNYARNVVAAIRHFVEPAK